MVPGAWWVPVLCSLLAWRYVHSERMVLWILNLGLFLLSNNCAVTSLPPAAGWWQQDAVPMWSRRYAAGAAVCCIAKLWCWLVRVHQMHFLLAVFLVHNESLRCNTVVSEAASAYVRLPWRPFCRAAQLSVGSTLEGQNDLPYQECTSIFPVRGNKITRCRELRGNIWYSWVGMDVI